MMRLRGICQINGDGDDMMAMAMVMVMVTEKHKDEISSSGNSDNLPSTSFALGGAVNDSRQIK